MPYRYSVEIHVDKSPSVMILRDMTEPFIRRMIFRYIEQLGMNIDYNHIQIPDDDDRCAFVASNDDELVLITVIYC